MAVGLALAAVLGSADGVGVGSPSGDEVGCEDGRSDGLGVGSFSGATLGAELGVDDGASQMMRSSRKLVPTTLSSVMFLTWSILVML